MARQDGYMEFPDGTHLSEARNADGGLSALARDEDNNLVTHGTFFATDGEDEADPNPNHAAVAAFVAGLAAAGGAFLGFRKARAWWQESGRQKFEELVASRPGRSKAEGPPDEGAMVEARQEPQTGEVEVTTPSQSERPRITEAEAAQMLVEAVRSRRYSDELVALLRRAEIIDGDAPGEVEAALQELTPERFESAMRKFLADNPGALEPYFPLVLQLGLATGVTSVEPAAVPAEALGEVPADEEDR